MVQSLPPVRAEIIIVGPEKKVIILQTWGTRVEIIAAATFYKYLHVYHNVGRRYKKDGTDARIMQYIPPNSQTKSLSLFM